VVLQCDYQRPSCGQCTRAGIVCEGYERQRVFILSTGGQSSKSGSPEKKEEDEDQTPTEEQQQPPQQQTPRAQRQQPQPGVIVRRPGPRTVAHKSLERTSFQDATLGLFWNDYLPGGKRFSPETAGMTIGSWTIAAEDLSHHDNVVKYPLLAVAAAHVGRTKGDPAMTARGMQMYGRGLVEIASALNDSKKARSDAVLAANRLLSFYTVCTSFLGARGQTLSPR
jgi:hypothetical protein